MPLHELQSLARHARERTLDDHTGEVRARQLLQYVEEARTAGLAPREFSPVRTEVVQ